MTADNKKFCLCLFLLVAGFSGAWWYGVKHPATGATIWDIYKIKLIVQDGEIYYNVRKGNFPPDKRRLCG